MNFNFDWRKIVQEIIRQNFFRETSLDLFFSNTKVSQPGKVSKISWHLQGSKGGIFAQRPKNYWKLLTNYWRIVSVYKYNLWRTTFKKYEGTWLAQADHIPSNFLKAAFHKFYLVQSWILCPTSWWMKAVHDVKFVEFFNSLYELLVTLS